MILVEHARTMLVFARCRNHQFESRNSQLATHDIPALERILDPARVDHVRAKSAAVQREQRIHQQRQA